MEHYFTEKPTTKSNKQKIEVVFDNKKYIFTTDNGIFSKDHLDEGTNILLHSFLKDYDKEYFSFLDLGCGYGVISTIIKSILTFSKATLSDINERAIELSVENMKQNYIKDFNIVKSDLFDKIKGSFDVIISNPPIRAGKSTLFKLYQDSYRYLNNNGVFYCVIMTKHGAKSTEKELKKIYDEVSCINMKNGFRVYKAIKKVSKS